MTRMRCRLYRRRCCPRTPCDIHRHHSPIRRGIVFAALFLVGAFFGTILSVRSGDSSADLKRRIGTDSSTVGDLAIGDKEERGKMTQATRSVVTVLTKSNERKTPNHTTTSKGTSSNRAKVTSMNSSAGSDAWSDGRPASLIWQSIKHNLSSGDPPFSASSASDRRVTLYVLVKSAPANSERRHTCRSAWQWRSRRESVVIPGLLAQFFLIGKAVDGKDHETVNANVLTESGQFHDIVLYPGNDTYRRLPWKVLWGFQHAMKTFDFDMMLLCDDDSFVNYPQVFKWIGGTLAERVYAGHLVSLEPAVQRDKKNPWYVSREVWPADHYPPYHWGAGYFMSRDLVNASLFESTHHDVLWIDDVFIGLLLNATGLVPQILDIPVYAQPDWKIFLCCEPSPLVLGSRKITKMKLLGTKQSKNEPLCRVRKNKYCMRTESP